MFLTLAPIVYLRLGNPPALRVAIVEALSAAGMGHSYANLLVHVLFSTKNREKRLSAEIRRNLFPYLAAVLNNQGSKPATSFGDIGRVFEVTRKAIKGRLDLQAQCAL